ELLASLAQRIAQAGAPERLEEPGAGLSRVLLEPGAIERRHEPLLGLSSILLGRFPDEGGIRVIDPLHRLTQHQEQLVRKEALPLEERDLLAEALGIAPANRFPREHPAQVLHASGAKGLREGPVAHGPDLLRAVNPRW